MAKGVRKGKYTPRPMKPLRRHFLARLMPVVPEVPQAPVVVVPDAAAASGDILYATQSGGLQSLQVGAAGQFLAMGQGGQPIWNNARSSASLCFVINGAFGYMGAAAFLSHNRYLHPPSDGE